MATYNGTAPLEAIVSKEEASRSIKDRLKNTGMYVAGKAREVLDYAIPAIAKYDAEKEAEVLARDEAVQNTGMSKAQITGYVKRSYEDNKYLMGAAKLADTSDRVTSTIGLVLEAAGLATGGVGSFLANGGEEAIEMVLKIPALALARKDKQRFYSLLGREIGTSLIPIVGDVYDIATNIYMTAAKDIIRDEAKQKMLAEHKKAE